jgi:putative phosphoesterase
MKILVLADIHANWPALAAIREAYDACLFLGDLVDYGSNPIPCIEWVKTHATAAVRGNHDHAVAQRIVARGGSGFRQLAAATRPLQWEVLAPSHLKYLARLPVTRHLRLGTTSYALVHATPRDPMDEYLLDDPAGWKTRLEGIDADILCVGHSHVQFHLDLDGVQVLNPGSVGQPRDGDPRCAYAMIEDGKVQLRRVEYDIDATIAHLRQSGINGEVLEMAESALRTGGRLPMKLTNAAPDGSNGQNH